MALPQSLRALILTLHIICLSSTALRVFDRFYMRRMWWDDYLAGIVLITDSLYLANAWRGFKAPAPAPSGFYSMFSGFTLLFATIWLSRITLALGLARIFPSSSKTRHVALGLAALLFITWISSLTALYMLCKLPGRSVLHLAWAQCLRSGSLKGVPLSAFNGILCDFIADLLLVVLPLIVLYRMKLPKHQHRLIIIATSGGVLTLTTIIVLWITWYGPFELTPKVIQINAIIAQVEVTSSVFVSNLLVVATFIYRAIRRWKANRARKNRPTKTVDELAQLHPRADDRRPAAPGHAQFSSQGTGQTTTFSSGGTLTVVSGITSTTTQRTTLTLTDVVTDFTEQSAMNSEYLDVDSQWVLDPRAPSNPPSHSV